MYKRSVNFYFVSKCCTDADVLTDQASDLTKELSVLKEFDLDSEFGPCIGMLSIVFIT